MTIEQGGASRAITTMGNGRLDAVSNAIKTYFGITYELSVYEEHAISRGSNSKAATYVGIVHDGKFYWGVGVDEDIIKSSIAALVSAVNKAAAEQHITSGREERIVEIISFIQKNYVDVTLDMPVDTFHLSKPYLSKYIKEKGWHDLPGGRSGRAHEKSKNALKGDQSDGGDHCSQRWLRECGAL